jgi:hypothetical protein
MNSIVAASLFDSPWVIAAFVIAGAAINWLSQRRQQKQERQKQEQEQRGGTPSAAPPKPAGEFDMEETLRRLLGEESLPPAAPSVPRPVPPPIPRPVAPPPRRFEEGDDETYVQLPPVMAPKPAWVVPTPRAVAAARQVDAAAREASAAPPAPVAPVINLGLVLRSRARKRTSWNWGSQAGARQAFVASLVFGPPKGLES